MSLRPLATSAWLLVVMACAACGNASAPAEGPARAADAAPARASVPASAAVPVPAARRIVILGDSITAGLGLPADQAYPALLQARLDARQAGWQVVNAGVSGDTSAGGVRRLDWSLDGGAAVIIIALGGNDALRGLPVTDLQKNLDEAVQRAQAAGARVVLAGMQAPPNTGPEYTAAFQAVYPAIASARGAALVPFLLDGVAGIESLNQADGIHPNQAGARLVADTVWRALEAVVRELEALPTR